MRSGMNLIWAFVDFLEEVHEFFSFVSNQFYIIAVITVEDCQFLVTIKANDSRDSFNLILDV